MTDFDRLNRENWEHNNLKPVNRFNTSVKYGTSEYWQNYWNNQTFKQNNGQYNNYYTYH